MKRTDVSHYEGLTWWGPVEDASMEAMLSRIDLPEGGAVLDLGCGRAELLVRLAERHRVRVVGVDRSAAALDMARAEFRARVPDASVSLIESDASGHAAEPESLSMVGFLGGPYVGGSFASTVSSIHRWLEPGGWFLAGHGFWLQPPPVEYLEATGIEAGEFESLDGTRALVERVGFDLVREHVSTEEEWDAFEDRILRNREEWCAGRPEDVEAHEALERSRSWNEAQRRWGRATMGYVTLLVRRS